MKVSVAHHHDVDQHAYLYACTYFVRRACPGLHMKTNKKTLERIRNTLGKISHAAHQISLL